MGPLIKFLLLALAVVWLWHSPALRSLRRQDGATPPRPRSSGTAPPPPTPPEDMVACHRCGVHLPSSEALRDAQGRPSCCPAHRDGH